MITLKVIGFEINPYDMFIVTIVVRQKQFTISWYLDDNKLSRNQDTAVNVVLEKIKTHFVDLKITIVNKNSLLGMAIILVKNSEEKIGMQDQLQETID